MTRDLLIRAEGGLFGGDNEALKVLIRRNRSIKRSNDIRGVIRRRKKSFA
jgi:hypothetical protein